MEPNQSQIIYENDIRTCIMLSPLSEAEKQKFLRLIIYFTPKEIEEIRELVAAV